MNDNLKNLQQVEYEKARYFLADEFRTTGISNGYPLLATAYAIVTDSENEASDFSSLDSFLATNQMTDDICEFIKKTLNGKWDIVIRAKSAFPPEIYKAFLLFDNNSYSRNSECDTPKSLIDLSLKMLNIESSDYVGDFCCGRGAFIREAILYQADAAYSGYEINISHKCIAEMRAELLDSNIEISNTDVLTLSSTDKFTKIFSNFPFSVKMFAVDNSNNKPLQYIYQNVPSASKKISSDWLFLTSVMNNLNQNGKAVAIMTPNSTYNLPDKEVRKFFVEKGFIESVIALPNNLLDSTSIPVIMIVLSFGNTGITFVNALEEFTPGRRKNSLSFDNIKEIDEATKKDTAISRKVSIEEISDKSFDLYPIKYLSDTPEIQDGVAFGTVIKGISRGAQIKAAELDTLVSDEYTGLHYLMLNDIQDGIINDKLPSINEIKPQYDRYCVEDKAFLLSKIGPVFKAAYIESKPNEKILINGNMYIIHLDYDKVNPYFLKAFLESETGQALLRSQCAGNSLLTISADALKKIVIPLPDMDKQNQLADLYRSKLEEVKILKEKLIKANNERLKIYDDFS